jgi:PKD repeat protein
MSVSYVTSSQFTLGSETTLGRILIPSSVISGHDLYCLVGSDGHTTSIAYPTVTDTDSGGNAFALQGETAARKGTLWWKKATTDTAGKLITVAGCVDIAVGGLSVYSGAYEAGNPTSNVDSELNNAGSPAHVAFTPHFENSMIALAVFNFFSNGTVLSLACSNPGALTTRFEQRHNNSTGAAVHHASAVQPGAIASTGTFTWVQSALTSRSIGWEIREGTPPSETSLGSGTSINPIHTYDAAGTYTIRLTVTDDLGASSTSTKAVTVS